MSFVLACEGGVRLLEVISTTEVPNWLAQIYVNDVTPAPSNVLADFTAADSISAISLTGLYSNPVCDISNIAHMDISTISFVQVAPISQTAWGWYVFDNPASTVIFAERFTPSNISLTALGDSIIVHDHRFNGHS